MITDNYIRYPHKFTTIEGTIYVGWWEGKEFKSETFKSKETKKATTFFKGLQQADKGK